MESITSEQKVHFYEYMEIEILHDYIQSGISYFFNAIFDSDRFIHLRYYSEEISSIVTALKDIYFLKKDRAFYSQKFYGLQRNTLNGNNKLTNRQILITLLMWHVIPYLFRKIEKAFKRLIEEEDQQNKPQKFLTRAFIKIFPILYLLVNVVQIAFKFQYLLFPEFKYYNLQYFFSKTQLDYVKTQEQEHKYPLFTLMKSPGLFFLLISHKIANYFFSRDHQNQKQLGSKQNRQIKPPLIYEIKPEEQRKDKVKECPICGGKWKNPAVLRCSGYVFCYSCIFQYAKKYKECPVTKILADEDSIQILYD